MPLDFGNGFAVPPYGLLPKGFAFVDELIVARLVGAVPNVDGVALVPLLNGLPTGGVVPVSGAAVSDVAGGIVPADTLAAGELPDKPTGKAPTGAALGELLVDPASDDEFTLGVLGVGDNAFGVDSVFGRPFVVGAMLAGRLLPGLLLGKEPVTAGGETGEVEAGTGVADGAGAAVVVPATGSVPEVGKIRASLRDELLAPPNGVTVPDRLGVGPLLGRNGLLSLASAVAAVALGNVAGGFCGVSPAMATPPER